MSIPTDTALYFRSVPQQLTHNIISVSIFCSAPFYLQQTVALYDYFTERGNACTIYVPGQRFILAALQEIGISKKHLLFEDSYVHIKLKKPATWVVALRAAQQVIRRHFPPESKQLIFVLAGMPDWFHYLVVARLASSHNLVDYGIKSTGLIPTKRPTFYSRVWQLFAKLVLRLHTSLYDFGFEGYNSLCWLNLPAHGIVNLPLGVDSGRLSKYRRPIITPSGSPVFLLVEDNETSHYKHYKSRLLDFLRQIKSLGFHIIIKPHPRRGCSSFLYEDDFRILRSYRPFQFYSLDNIDVICGFYSGCLHDSVLNGREAFSLETAFDRFAADQREWALNLLTKEERLVTAGKSITLVHSLEEFVHLLRQRMFAPVNQ